MLLKTAIFFFFPKIALNLKDYFWTCSFSSAKTFWVSNRFFMISILQKIQILKQIHTGLNRAKQTLSCTNCMSNIFWQLLWWHVQIFIHYKIEWKNFQHMIPSSNQRKSLCYKLYYFERRLFFGHLVHQKSHSKPKDLNSNLRN